MRDRIRDVLVARILDGTYVAGTQLKELILAREFNVSQAPIREALRELEGSGLVMSERYRGTRVRGADLDEMRESYELRATLEARAIELGVPCAPNVLAELDACVNSMAEAVEHEDSERYIDESLRMHRALIAASGNRVFISVWDSLHFDVRGRIALRRIIERGVALAPFIELHRRLIEAVRAQEIPDSLALVREIFAGVMAAFSRA
jgi:DNA-binding GntR family transcriptional regulator